MQTRLEKFNTGHMFIFTLCCAYVFLSLIKLDAVPRSFGDESWYAVPTWTLITAGVPRNPVIPGRGGLEHFYLQPKLVLTLAAAPFASAFGIRLFSFRLASALFGLFGLLGVYLLAKEVAGAVVGRVCALLLLISPWFLIVARTFRPEIFVLATITCFSALMLVALRKNSNQLALLSGIFIACALCSHQNAILSVFCFCLALLITYPQKKQLIGNFIYVAAGVILGLMPYIVYAAWGHTYSEASFWTQFFGEGVVNEYSGSSALVQGELARWSNFLRLPYGIIIAAFYIAALVAGFIIKNWKSKLIATFLILHIILMPFIIRIGTGRYLAVLLPFFSLLVAQLYFHLHLWFVKHWPNTYKMTRKSPGKAIKLVRYVSMTFLAVYVAMMVGQDAIVAYFHRNASYGRHISEIRRFVPDQAVVCAPVFYWIGFSDNEFVCSNIAPEFGEYKQDKFEWFFNRIESKKPDILLQTTSFLQSTGGISGAPTTFDKYKLNLAIDTVTAERGQLITTVASWDYGPVRIWKLKWDGPLTAKP